MSMCKIIGSVLLVFNVFFCECSNIFHERSKVVYRPDDNSEYFGFSVSLSKQWLIVGAPKARSRLRRISSGQVFRCPVRDLDTKHNVACQPIGVNYRNIEDQIFSRSFTDKQLFNNDMWFGATVSALPDGAVFACAPRWINSQTEDQINGMCYMFSSTMTRDYRPLSDANRQTLIKISNGEEFIYAFYMFGQTGFSTKVSENNIILGSPGLGFWMGGVEEYRFTQNNLKYSYLHKQTTTDPYYTREISSNAYLGYSVESGIFERNGTLLTVAGAPKSHLGRGQVLIFKPSNKENSPFDIKNKVVGDQLGSYFGATLCCSDINGDGIVDLLVGAPNYVMEEGKYYDQGAVFVYLTNTQKKHFSLDATNYVSGSKESGARFGTSIAALGDIDGDGFNDIAIGAPWEDEGKGAVYIYRGGKKGLLRQYEQRITVAGSKTFGYSITKGVDMDGNNCNDFAVGAYNIREAYIFRCTPTVHVNISIKVPDAMSIPLNATNFTALFCAKSTQITAIPERARSTWLMKLNFTAKIVIDTKQNRVTLIGNTKYDLSIKAGDEMCDKHVILIKPRADLSKPISIKFKLEDNSLLEDSQKFPQYGARLSTDSILETSFHIQIRKDCGNDLICKPLLLMSLEPLSSTYVPGTNDTLGVRVSVNNSEEPSYNAKVHLTLPLPPKRLPSECSLAELIVTCNLPAPFSKSESVTWEIELEHAYKDSVAKELNVAATLEDPFYDVTDVNRKHKEIVILIKPEAKIAVSGKALPNVTIAVTRNKFNEAGNVTFVHYFEVINFGPSDWFRLPVQIFLPEKVNLSSQIKECIELDLELECTWNMPAQVSLPIVLPLRFDMSLYGQLLEENNEFNITTSIMIILEEQNKTVSVTTTLILEPAPPIWPYIVGGIAGLLLLSIIILVLYKYGFFSRNRPENHKRPEQGKNVDEENTPDSNLEEARSSDAANKERTNSVVAEPSHMTGTSSQEQLIDDKTLELDD